MLAIEKLFHNKLPRCLVLLGAPLATVKSLDELRLECMIDKSVGLLVLPMLKVNWNTP